MPVKLSDKDKFHPRRCIARSKSSGEQCIQWMAKDHDKWCRYHGGRFVKSIARRGTLDQDIKKLSYSRYLGRRLADVVKDAADDNQIISLRSELALARAMVIETLEVSNAVDEEIIKCEDDGNPMDALKVATMRSKIADEVLKRLRVVESIAKSAQFIENDTLLDVVALHKVVLQVSEIMDEGLIAFADEMPGGMTEQMKVAFLDLNRNIGDRIVDEVQLPKSKAGESSVDFAPGELTAQVLAMDGTIPQPTE